MLQKWGVTLDKSARRGIIICMINYLGSRHGVVVRAATGKPEEPKVSPLIS